MPLSSPAHPKPDGVVLFGAGQTAEVLEHYITADHGPHFPIMKTVDDSYFERSDPTPNLVPFDECARRYSHFPWLVALSYSHKNVPRARLVQYLQSNRLSVCAYVHPTANLWSHAVLRPNHIFLENSVVQFGAKVGGNTILWSGAHVGHHSSIGRDGFVASGAVVSGGVKIGTNSFFGVNSFVADGVSAGNFLYVAAGTGLSKDCGDFTVVSDRPDRQK